MLTNYERETIITFNEAETDCEIYTYNQKLIDKLSKLCASHGDIYKLVNNDTYGGLTFRFPKAKLRMNFGIPLPERSFIIVLILSKKDINDMLLKRKTA